MKPIRLSELKDGPLKSAILAKIGTDAPHEEHVIVPAPKIHKGMNKTEQEALRLIERMTPEHARVLPHESITLKVGDDRCRYTPDFAVVDECGGLSFYEVKGGHVWDDARVKFQSAKKQYPWFRWYWMQKKQGEWKIT